VVSVCVVDVTALNVATAAAAGRATGNVAAMTNAAAVVGIRSCDVSLTRCPAVPFADAVLNRNVHPDVNELWVSSCRFATAPRTSSNPWTVVAVLPDDGLAVPPSALANVADTVRSSAAEVTTPEYSKMWIAQSVAPDSVNVNELTAGAFSR
jgi:hypothetical protein